MAFVVGVALLVQAVGNNQTDGRSPVAQQLAQSGQGGTLHLKVGYLAAHVLKALHLLILVRVGQGDAQLAPLRTIETAASYRDPMYHLATGYALAQLLVSMDDVGVGDAEVAAPPQVVEQRALHR